MENFRRARIESTGDPHTQQCPIRIALEYTSTIYTDTRHLSLGCIVSFAIVGSLG